MRTGRLLIKIYLGFVLSLVILTGVFSIFVILVRSTRQDFRKLVAELLIRELAQSRHDPAAQQAVVAHLKEYPRFPVSLYDPAGRLIVATATPAHRMPSGSELARLIASEQVQPVDSQFVQAVKENGRLVAVGIMSERPPRKLVNGDRR